MKKLLIVDDDDAMRGVIRMRLSEQYEIFDTGDPEQALALALEHKPDAVLLDLRMPKFSGLELRNSFHSLSHTSRLPIFVISGESGAKYKEYCAEMGVKGFFEKPIDFAKLRASLSEELGSQRMERRSQVRVQMRVALNLRGVDSSGKQFEELAETENVSAGGLLCTCSRELLQGASLDVYRTGPGDRYVGLARVIRRESSPTPGVRFALKFSGKPVNWVVQS
jgi:response regulator RpfG family c-di-GMP phosphodiesterase